MPKQLTDALDYPDITKGQKHSMNMQLHGKKFGPWNGNKVFTSRWIKRTNDLLKQ